jgi:putative transposase
MEFYENQFFHVYNQGNNRQKLFFSKANYEFFRFKIGNYITPFAKIIAYCLMPNHFHLLFFVEQVEISRNSFKTYTGAYRKAYYRNNGIRKKPYLSQVNTWKSGGISLNDAIGIMQRSYTRAINKEMNWTGSLFREGCKAKDGWNKKFQTIGDSNHYIGNDFLSKCFYYIEENPSSAGLVENREDWLYSSNHEYRGKSDFPICDIPFGKEVLGF